MSLPSTLKAEVKLTTGTGVSVSSRELDALAPVGPDELGVLAVLFWCEEREVAGRWILADAALLAVRRHALGLKDGALRHDGPLPAHRVKSILGASLEGRR